MLGSLILYLKGMRRMMFQLSGFYCRELGLQEVGKQLLFGGFRNWGTQKKSTLNSRILIIRTPK